MWIVRLLANDLVFSLEPAHYDSYHSFFKVVFDCASSRREKTIDNKITVKNKKVTNIISINKI